jgi:hypothetical protein
MAANHTIRRWRMAGYIWGLVAIVVLGIVLAVVWASSSSRVFAAYPGAYEFTGIDRFRGTDYFALKWVPNPGEVGPCPIVIHTEAGDVGAAEFEDPKRLLERGWVEVPFLPVVPEWAAVAGPDPPPGLPKVVKYGHGDLRVATVHSEGVLTSVSVFVVNTREERIAQGLPPEHEHMATRIGAMRYPISVGGRRITLPLSQAEMIEALGPPDNERRDY